MSLAFNVVAGARRGAGRMAVALAATMCATLLMSAWAGWEEAQAAGADPRRWWLPLACAVACLACCLAGLPGHDPGGRPQPGLRHFFRRLRARDRALRLVVAPDGAARLGSADDTPVAAEVVGAWRLGSVLYLRLRPEGARRDRGLLLLRTDVAPDQWHCLRRWQVWLRRSLNVHRTNARSA